MELEVLLQVLEVLMFEFMCFIVVLMVGLAKLGCSHRPGLADDCRDKLFRRLECVGGTGALALLHVLGGRDDEQRDRDDITDTFAELRWDPLLCDSR